MDRERNSASLIFWFCSESYLKKLQEHSDAVICLGDSAYHRSSVKGEMGIARPVPQRKDGVQQKVTISAIAATKTDVDELPGRGSDEQP